MCRRRSPADVGLDCSQRKMEDLSGWGVGIEIILAGKPHSHVSPRASGALRLDFLLRALSSHFLSRALIRRGCEQSHVGFVC